jgi:hypothetical protein
VLTSGSVAQAQTVVPTKGEAPKASGGQAWTRLIADLKKFPTPASGQAGCGSLWQGYYVCASDYDDDPGGVSTNFMVSPNLADDPLQHAWKILFFDFHSKECLLAEEEVCSASNDIQAIQKEIFWKAPHPQQTGPGPDQNADGQRVLHEVIEARLPNGAVDPNVIITGNACNVIGVNGGAGDIASGLVLTGQVGDADLSDMIAKCIQNEGGFHLNNWTVSKHLPPGTYREVITLVHTNGAETAPVSVDFVIEPLSHYVIDFQLDEAAGTGGIVWSGLSKDNPSVHSGDWSFATPNKPTIMGDGNTSLVLRARYAPLVNESGKIIWSDFDIQINRQDGLGTLIEWQHIDGILASQTPGQFGAFAELGGPTTTTGGRPSSGAVCLEPNEPLKLDFSITPRQTVFQGVYSGAVELEARVVPTICTPSFDQGESTTGDTNVFDNNPSQGGPNNPNESP